MRVHKLPESGTGTQSAMIAPLLNWRQRLSVVRFRMVAPGALRLAPARSDSELRRGTLWVSSRPRGVLLAARVEARAGLSCEYTRGARAPSSA